MNIFNKDLITRNTADLIFLLYKRNFLQADNKEIQQDFDINSFNNILIFSPHMDDEIIGAGNLLFEYSKNMDFSKKLTVCYLVDNNGQKYKKRILESEKICKNLNANRVCFEFEDSKMNYSSLFSKIADLILQVHPQLVLFSDFSFGNAHPDHDLLATAIHENMLSFNEIKFLGYEVLCPIKSNYLFSSTSSHKIKLVKIYKTQIKKINYAKFLKKKAVLEGRFNEHYFLYANNTCKF